MGTYKDKNGRWYVSKRYIDWKGQRQRLYKRGFETKKNAELYEAGYMSKIYGKQDMLFDEFVDLYYEDLKSQIKLNTLLTKEAIIENKIRPYFKNLKMDQITSRDVMKWENSMLDSKTSTGKEYSKRTLQTAYAQLSAIFNHAMKYYNLDKNPTKVVGNFKDNEMKERQIWTVEEYKKFSRAIMDKPISCIAFEILFWIGMRLGELLALTPDDIDYEKNVIRINKSYQRLKGEDVITTPKTRKSNRYGVCQESCVTSNL